LYSKHYYIVSTFLVLEHEVPPAGGLPNVHIYPVM